MFNLKFGYIFIGYLREKFPIKEYGKYKSREFRVFRIFRFKNRWRTALVKFKLTGDDIERLDTIELNEEVAVRWDFDSRLYKINGVIQYDNDGFPIYFQNLLAFDVYVSGKRKAEPYIYAIENWSDVKSEDKNAQAPDMIENRNDPVVTYKVEQVAKEDKELQSKLNLEADEDITEDLPEDDLPF